MHNRPFVTSQIFPGRRWTDTVSGKDVQEKERGLTSVTAGAVRAPKETVVLTISIFTPLSDGEKDGKQGSGSAWITREGYDLQRRRRVEGRVQRLGD